MNQSHLKAINLIFFFEKVKIYFFNYKIFNIEDTWPYIIKILYIFYNFFFLGLISGLVTILSFWMFFIFPLIIG